MKARPASASREKERIYLSPPHIGEEEIRRVVAAMHSNWIAPLGPEVEAFEREFAALIGVKNALALASGTAALHLALRLLDVGEGDEVWSSTFTFVAGASPILYQQARPVFIDSERTSWNLDPQILDAELQRAAEGGRLPKALVVTDVLGQCADYEAILSSCGRYGVPVVEDAAEALGATYKDRPAGRFGRLAAFSFNGNKIITTSGGGMLVSDEPDLIEQARKLSAHSRDPGSHYQHSLLGYNYRMSNLLAALGRAQLEVLEDRIEARRRIFDIYRDRLGDLPGLDFMPEAPWGRSTRWLTCLTVDPDRFGADREAIRKALEGENIESRPVWKPLHRQPLFAGCRFLGGTVAEELFSRGLCLPSGSSLSAEDQERIVEIVARCGREA